MIEQNRIRFLNQVHLGDGPFVVYWMQSSQRAIYNHALEYAIQQSNQLEKPLIVYFGVTDYFPEANERHYLFLLEGLQDVKDTLASRGIRLLVLHESPEKGAILLSKSAAILITDQGYLRVEREWRNRVAQEALCTVVQVETNAVVPVETASCKEEYSAATIRSKLQKILPHYFMPVEEEKCFFPSLTLDLRSQLKLDQGSEILILDDLTDTLSKLKIDRSIGAVSGFRGGSREAQRHLEEFIANRLSGYADQRNQPGGDHASNLSPYLHFGHISPLQIALRVIGSTLEGNQHSTTDQESFLEELIVRRELSINFVYYNPNYDRYESLPNWARNTLAAHQNDPRIYLYTKEELEAGKTHDSYWNAAQKELRIAGKMDGYMRMYWGKKILEWTAAPEEAFAIALDLNNRYSLDGRDPNGFAGVAWCFGKHDRPWSERAIFGNVRYMNDKGLERKFDMKHYLNQIEKL